MIEQVLVVAAHPDDEALGCAGTLIKHLDHGDEVSLLFMTDGITGRESANESDKELRRKNFEKAMNFLPYHNVKSCSFPDNAMDTVPFIGIVREVESFMEEVKPSIVYTHFEGDLNIDHRICYQAVVTACRPTPTSTVNEIYSFEVLSSTEWNARSDNSFRPNFFVDIGNYLQKKIDYINCYDDEMRDSPHARSYDNVRSLATLRGATVGVSAAEAFMMHRTIKR